jgi:hypothetical protein
MYYTGLDPFTKKPVYIAKALNDRKLQRALMQFFKAENYFEVRDALQKAKRLDLIGEGCDCLIPSRPPREALEARQRQANERFRGDYVHTIAQADSVSPPQRKQSKKEQRPGQSPGYRPSRRHPRKKA